MAGLVTFLYSHITSSKSDACLHVFLQNMKVSVLIFIISTFNMMKTKKRVSNNLLRHGAEC
jgi:hypothetical protein